MLSIFKKEWKSFFHSPLAYIYIAVVSMIVGFFFYYYNLLYGYPYFNYTLVSLLPRMVTVALIPLLTMRIFAEETHNKSDQMLLTAPVKLWEIVLGKFLAVAAVFGLVMLLCCLYPLVIVMKGDYYYLPADYLTILTFFLYGCVFIAVGVFMSSITEYTAVSAVLSFVAAAVIILYSMLYSLIPTATYTEVVIGCIIIVVALALFLFGITKNKLCSLVVGVLGLAAVIITRIADAEALSDVYTAVLEKLNYTAPLTDIINNSVFSIPGVILYLSTIFMFLMLTIQVLHKRRWN